MTAPFVQHSGRGRSKPSVPIQGELVTMLSTVYVQVGRPVTGQLWEREAERAEKFDAEICYIPVYTIDGEHKPQIYKHEWVSVGGSPLTCLFCKRVRDVN